MGLCFFTKVVKLLSQLTRNYKVHFLFIFFPNKLKSDDSNIYAKLLIMKQKIINICPSDTMISLKSNLLILKPFALLPEDGNILVTRDNALHR